MKLRYYMNSKGKKIYTLEENVKEGETKDAHYKFVKIRNAPKTK